LKKQENEPKKPSPGIAETSRTVAHCIVAIILLAFSPVLIPSHFLLKRLGRKGFYFEKERAIIIGKKSFKKKEE